eukprot:507346_1
MTSYKINPSTFDQYILKYIEIYDVRYPTSDFSHGSDAVHVDPDYSAAYILLKFVNKNNNSQIVGHGMTFTLGKGTEIVCACIQSMFPFVRGISFGEIVSNPLAFSRILSNHPQMRWLGPEKGVMHLASAAFNNAIFDLWSWCYNKPLWKFLTDMNVDELVDKCVDFKYLTDVLNAPQIKRELKQNQLTKQKKIDFLNYNGYPLYVTAAGWLGYSDEKVRFLCKKYLKLGFRAFKMKVGRNVQDDIRRARIMRESIGDNCLLMMDSNQVWDISTAIEWMKQLAFVKPYWIEEPTSPDDIIGHKTIKDELNKLNIGVATGEMCQNKVMFKQLLQAKAVNFAQPDTARLNSVPEILAVLIMCKQFDIPAVFHAGGVGLNEMVRHYIMFDYVMITGTLKNRICEYAQHLKQHFEEECEHQNGKYYPPTQPGFIRMKMSSIREYQFPNGAVWRNKLMKLNKQRQSKL